MVVWLSHCVAVSLTVYLQNNSHILCRQPVPALLAGEGGGCGGGPGDGLGRGGGVHRPDRVRGAQAVLGRAAPAHARGRGLLADGLSGHDADHLRGAAGGGTGRA